MSIGMNSNIEKNRVSVIIPTYNRAEFLGRAVRSVIKQEYDNIEIIIVDDMSTDNTQSVVKSLMTTFPSIVYGKNDHNKGPSGARNTGILKSSGDYIAFLDSDDIWLEGHLRNGVKLLENNPEIDVLFGNFKVADYHTDKHRYNFFDQKKILFTLNSVQITPNIRILQDNLFEALIQENFFHFGSSIIRKSSLGEILLDESVMYAEDRDFAIRLYKEASGTFAYRENPVFILYKHDSNLIKHGDLNNGQQVIEAHLYLFAKYLRSYDLSHSEKRTLTNLISKRLLNLSYAYRTKKEHHNAFSCVIKSFKYSFSLNQFKELIKVLITRGIRSI